MENVDKKTWYAAVILAEAPEKRQETYDKLMALRHVPEKPENWASGLHKWRYLRVTGLWLFASAFRHNADPEKVFASFRDARDAKTGNIVFPDIQREQTDLWLERWRAYKAER